MNNVITFVKIGALTHRRRKVRILGGQALEYWGARGANSQQVHDVVLTLMRRHFDVMCPLGS